MFAIGIGATAFSPASVLSQSRVQNPVQVRMAVASDVKPVVVGIAADSGCGKSTFMRRLTSIFGGESKLNDIGRETNTLVSDMTTVICLDDYHKWDRTGRKSNPEWPDGITALHKDCQNWDKMAEDVTNLKSGVAIEKPIYNHITGELDADEPVSPTPIVIFEGLHPMLDDRVNEALDLSVYLDITDDVKFAWKAQRDIAERGATMEDVHAMVMAIVDKELRNEKSDWPRRPAEAQSLLTLRDFTGAMLLHNLLLAGAQGKDPRAHKLFLEIVHKVPRLLLDVHDGRLIFHGEGPLHVLAVNGRSLDDAEVVEKIAIDCLRTFRRAIAERKISPNELVSPRQWEDEDHVKAQNTPHLHRTRRRETAKPRYDEAMHDGKVETNYPLP